ncbi:glucose dehydrogenase [FAD, quinone]-like isoform X1 [Phlebotomus papatasi]|uniref:glucose dehydrogenase [FAD, quinone]-like isoform X1 n=1 Tax=Phlebotomus papatasi TaxID=29031 RepID=UPI002483D8BF|nr:glucose dehydrogenase [FAD, quinone]-like isoform X1 [Phlebotomus papatasi]XP_055698377.1 glucose dehydrogenase [FAD, quinone]-like isoform X1 [Phlebotomus papatasi]XP_055698379.1 glucose dehydrogenase [FAD, quinone]-like isoform X1 [Phlebotomus papatasi]
METFTLPCASQSVGPANQLIGLLINTLLASQCALSPPEMWPKDYGPTALEKGFEEYDFIVVGAGSAGSVVASRLSENPNWKVLLLEAGGDPPIESEMPCMQFTLQNTPYDWNFRTAPSKKSSLSHPNGILWSRGKFLGGTSGMNHMLHLRGNNRDYDRWEMDRNVGWGWNTVLQYFKKSEDMLNDQLINTVAATNHGRGGPLKIDTFRNTDPMRDALQTAAIELGHRIIPDIYGDEYLGFGSASANIDNGTRCSSARGYLVPARDRPNLHVIKNAHVTKVKIDPLTATATGVYITFNKMTEMIVNARKEVILSAGVINTPQILMLSGIGPQKYMKKLNIPMVTDLPVGKSLQDQITVPFFMKIPKNTQGPPVQVPIENVPQPPTETPICPHGIHQKKPVEFTREEMDAFYHYLTKRNISESYILDFVGFFNTVNLTDRYPDIQIQYNLFKMGDKAIFLKFLEIMGYDESINRILESAIDQGDLLISWIILLQPKSMGKLKMQTANPLDALHINHKYLEKRDDVDTLVRGIEIQKKFLLTMAFRQNQVEELQIPILTCGINDGTKRYWDCYSRHMVTTTYNTVGTAKMGPDTDRMAVVDPRLNVRGVKGLRVVDASIMPTLPSGGVNAPTVMIAEKASDIIKEDWIARESLATRLEL